MRRSDRPSRRLQNKIRKRRAELRRSVPGPLRSSTVFFSLTLGVLPRACAHPQSRVTLLFSCVASHPAIAPIPRAGAVRG